MQSLLFLAEFIIVSEVPLVKTSPVCKCAESTVVAAVVKLGLKLKTVVPLASVKVNVPDAVIDNDCVAILLLFYYALASISTAKYSAVTVLSVPLAVVVPVPLIIVHKNSPGFSTPIKSLSEEAPS